MNKLKQLWDRIPEEFRIFVYVFVIVIFGSTLLYQFFLHYKKESLLKFEQCVAEKANTLPKDADLVKYCDRITRH